MQGMNIKTGKTISGTEHLKQSITNILTTPIGSRVMKRDYGSRIFERIDSPINGDLIAEIYSDIVEAIDTWEPRFEVTNVSVVSADEGNLVIDLEGKDTSTDEQITLDNIKIL